MQMIKVKLLLGVKDSVERMPIFCMKRSKLIAALATAWLDCLHDGIANSHCRPARKSFS
jgi:hypothetical protein